MLHVSKRILRGSIERLLSLSKDLENPRWKPLHKSRGWNARNRRLKDTVKVPEGWKKKRGPKRGILTLGGVKRLETARKRKQ